MTSTELLAAAAEALKQGGYLRAEPLSGDWPVQSAALFEDPYGVVAIVVYETWDDLVARWSDAQAVLVDVISQHFSSSESKAWDGYLVLLTPSLMPSSGDGERRRIQYDTTRVRKIVASGTEIKGLVDVARVLLPLLPLDDIQIGPDQSALAVLPNLLASKGIPADAAKALVAAFQQQEPLVETLHKRRSKP